MLRDAVTGALVRWFADHMSVYDRSRSGWGAETSEHGWICGYGAAARRAKRVGRARASGNGQGQGVREA